MYPSLFTSPSGDGCILLLDTIITILGTGKYSVSWKQQKNVPFTNFFMFPLLIFSEPTNPTCVTMSQQIAMLFSHPLTTVQTLYLGLYMQILFLLKLYLSESYCTLLCLDVASSRYILWQGNSGVTWFFPLTL